MIRGGRTAELKAELATARREVAQLTNELQRLKMEGLQGNVFAAAIELSDRMDAQLAEEDEVADDTTQEHLQALVLREMLLDLCESVERAMVSVRAQLSTGLRPSELDRRKGDRRLSHGVAAKDGSVGVGIRDLPAISAADPSSQRIGSPNGDGKVDATEAATRIATEAASKIATEAASKIATEAATDAASRIATGAATKIATEAATRIATEAATRIATEAATRIAIEAARKIATEAASKIATEAPTRTSASKTTASKTTASKTTASRTNASKTNASKTNASRTTPSRTTPSKTTASKTNATDPNATDPNAGGSSNRKRPDPANTSATTGGSRSAKE